VVQVTPADRQYFAAASQVDAGSFVVAARDVADGTKIHRHRAVHLHEVRAVELGDQIFQWRPYQGLAADAVDSVSWQSG